MKVESIKSMMRLRYAQIEQAQDKLRDEIDYDIWVKYQDEMDALNRYLQDTPYK